VFERFEKLRINKLTNSLLQVSDNLVSVLTTVLATANVNPVILAVAGFKNQLIEVGISL
jgi:hypothetical protein